MKKRIWLTSVAVMLCALFAAGSAVAYFSAVTQPVVNVITTGEAKIELREEDEWSEGAQPLAPGETIDKTPTIANTGSVKVYARIHITMDTATAAMLKNGTVSLRGVNTTDWAGMPSSFDRIDVGKGLDIVATLREPLSAGEVSPPLFTGVSLAPRYVEQAEGTLNITLTAEAVQTIDGKTPAECWGLL